MSTLEHPPAPTPTIQPRLVPTAVFYTPQGISPRVKALRIVAVGLALATMLILIPGLSLAGIMSDVNLNILGRFLCYAVVALGIDLIWGYGGILSLCQALFFCLGAYAVGMYLSLPQGGAPVQKVYHDIPQFFFFNNRTQLPLFWKPFESLPAAIAIGLVVSAAFAAVFGFFIFRSRVRGVYFAIITQALAWATYLLFNRNELLLGGTDGLNDFYPPLNHAKKFVLGLYLLTVVVLIGAYLFCHYLVHTRFGRILKAVRDRETRLNFAGYKPYAYKVFAFTVAAVLATIGGMLYVPQNGIVTPDMMRVAASIGVVVWVATGGRGRLWGAILGALIVRYAYSTLTADVPNAWPFVEGGLFIAVVLLFPDGFVGLWDALEARVTRHENLLSIVVTALPLVAVVSFVLVEAIGVMPAFLQKTVATHIRFMPQLQIKFLALLGLLLACGLIKWGMEKAGRWNRRDEIVPSLAATTGPANAEPA